MWDKDVAEWKIWSRGQLAVNQDFGEGRGRKLIVRKMLMYNLGNVPSKLVYLNVSQTGVWERNPQPPVATGVWGQSSQPLDNFRKFLEKKAILIPLDHISHVFTAVWNSLIFNIWKPIEQI